MDPISIIGTAAAVLDFVTFGYKLITCAAELQSSTAGALEENTDREVVTCNIQSILGSPKKTKGKDGEKGA